MKKVRIKGLPKKSTGGRTTDQADQGLRRFLDSEKTTSGGMNQFSAPEFDVNKSITGVPASQANVEAEGGEQAIVPGQGGIPESYSINGPRHAQGGVPLNLEDDSFIFSDAKKKMKIKDKEILQEFGESVSKKKQKGKTPAEIAKKYDINEYKKILLDPNSDKLERETAEQMIKNYNVKLGKLSLYQESMKGFPQGAPKIATPYMSQVGLNPEEFSPEEPMETAQQESMEQYQVGGQFTGKFWDSVLPKAQEGIEQKDDYNAFATLVKLLSQQGAQTDKTGNVIEKDKPKSEQIPDKYKDPMYDESNEKFDRTTLKAGDMYKSADGTWKKVVFNPLNKTYRGEDFDAVFKGTERSQRIANNYQYISDVISDPEVMAKMGEKTRAALKNDQYYKRKQGKASKRGFMSDEEIDKLTDQEIAQNYLEMQKRNSALAARGIKTTDFRDSDGKVKPEFADKYKDLGITSLYDAFEKVGMPLTPGEKKIGLQQATYWGYRDLVKDKSTYSPEMQEKLKHLRVPQRGETDEGQTGDDQISPIDLAYTNTSAGELAGVSDFTIEDINLPEEEKDRSIKPNPPAEYDQAPDRDEWWLQDVVNLADLTKQRLNLKKYLPNAAPYDLTSPDVLYYDPSRALAANAEQANIAAQTIGAFAGPQGTYRLSGVQGEAFKNAANIAAEYEARNVGVGNQYLSKVADTMNKEHVANQELNKKLYDQTVIANQEFDNSVRKTERNIADAFISAIDNKKQAQALNTLYPQYETIPSIGGGLYFTEGRDFVDTGHPGTSGGSGYIDEYNQLINKYGETNKDAIKTYVDQKYGMSGPAKATGYTHPQIANRTQAADMLSVLQGMHKAFGGSK